MNYDEESENEMIQSADLTDLKPLAEDEKRYKSLHSHVKYYNEHNAKNEKQYSNVFYMQPYAEEIFNLQEDKPFIAGFKHELDKVVSYWFKYISSKLLYIILKIYAFKLKYFFLSIFKIVKQMTVTYITPIKTINNISFHNNKRSIQNLRKLQNYIPVTTGIFLTCLY